MVEKLQTQELARVTYFQGETRTAQVYATVGTGAGVASCIATGEFIFVAQFQLTVGLGVGLGVGGTVGLGLVGAPVGGVGYAVGWSVGAV